MTPQTGARAVGSALPRAGVAVAIIVLGVVTGVAGSVVVGGPPAESTQVAEVETAAGGCDSDTEPLHVAADGAVVDIVQRLADRYAEEVVARGRPCVDIQVRRVPSSAVVGRLTNGWRPQTHGPRPEVWIPQSTVWVELLRQQLDENRKAIIDPEPIILARSPTVMAMPRPMAEAVGWPDAQVSWEQIAELADSDEGWAALDHPEWGAFRLWLTDPRYTTVGLQTLLALEAAQEGTQAASGDGADAQASTDDGSPESIEAAQARLGLFRVQRLLSNIDPSTDEQLERYATADDPLGTVSAFPLEERQLWQYNQGLVGEGASSASSAPSDGRDDTTLAAVYPTGDLDIAMESDYPYVLLDAEWVAQDVLQYADEFGDYLVGDVARDMFAEQGFRGPDNEPSDALRSDDDVLAVNAVNDPPSGSLPDTAALSSLRSSWVNVPRLSTTLFVVDVSGSMVVPVPGTDKTRLQATIDAAKETLQIVPPSGEVGLWEFSTELQGGRNDGDYRELVTIGPLDEEVYGTTRYDRLVEALDGLEAENDTALHDTIVAAYRAMQEVYEPGNSHTIILLTDGRNDDDDSLSHEEMLELLVRERDVNQPIRVVSIAYGEQTDIDELAAVSEAVSGQVLASPELDNLDRLFIEALSGPGLDRT